MKQFVGSLSVAVLLAAGCKSKPLGSPPTVEEAQAAVAELEKINTGTCNESLARELFDTRAFAMQLFDGSEALAKGAERELTTAAPLSKVFCSGDAPTFLRLQTVKGEPKPVFRRDGGKGVSYYRLDLLKRDGKVRVSDWIDFAQGAALSETTRSLIAANIKTDDATASGFALQRISTLIAASDNAEARKAIAELPAAVKAAKGVRVLEVTASSDLPREEYAKVLDAFAKDFGTDPSMQLMLLDHYFLAKRYDAVWSAVASLRTLLGDDAELHLFEANAYVARAQEGDLAKAEAELAAALKLEPGFVKAISSMMDLRFAQKDVPGAVAAIRAFYAATKKQLSRSKLSTLWPTMLQSAEFDVLEQEGALIP